MSHNNKDTEDKPSFLRALVDKLVGDGNPHETDGDPYGDELYTQQFEVGGDDVDVEYFEDQPRTMRWWSSKNGSMWRTNDEGTPI